jgi:hypothetical protein
MDEHGYEFEDWEGEAVQVSYPGGSIPADYGVLEEVNEWGLVLRSRRRLTWPDPTAGEEHGLGGQDVRLVSEFRPWHVISGVRVLEPEEREGHGL